MKCTKLAIKAIKKSAQPPQVIEDECNLIQEISHPNIMSAIDIIDQPNYKCVIMPLATGGDLFEFIANQDRIPEDVACKIIYSCLKALDYLHSLGIWHRDIKPENFLLFDDDTQNPDVRLTDLGFSKRFAPGEMSTDKLGTPLYAAPEIYAGKPYNEKVDLWSLGVVMYMLLSKEAPFPQGSRFELQSAILSGDYSLDSEGFEDVSEEAKDLIRHLMEVNPEERLSAADALENIWFQNFFPDRNKTGAERRVAGYINVTQAFDDADEFDGFDGGDDDDFDGFDGAEVF
jgi:serine/threonine protein kinase